MLSECSFRLIMPLDLRINWPYSRWAFLALLIDGGAGGKKAPLPKICYTYSARMKLGTVLSYLKKIKKNVNHLTHPLRSADISIFYRKSTNFVISRNTDID